MNTTDFKTSEYQIKTPLNEKIKGIKERLYQSWILIQEANPADSFFKEWRDKCETEIYKGLGERQALDADISLAELVNDECNASKLRYQFSNLNNRVFYDLQKYWCVYQELPLQEKRKMSEDLVELYIDEKEINANLSTKNRDEERKIYEMVFETPCANAVVLSQAQIKRQKELYKTLTSLQTSTQQIRPEILHEVDMFINDYLNNEENDSQGILHIDADKMQKLRSFVGSIQNKEIPISTVTSVPSFS